MLFDNPVQSAHKVTIHVKFIQGPYLFVNEGKLIRYCEKINVIYEISHLCPYLYVRSDKFHRDPAQWCAYIALKFINVDQRFQCQDVYFNHILICQTPVGGTLLFILFFTVPNDQHIIINITVSRNKCGYDLRIK